MQNDIIERKLKELSYYGVEVSIAQKYIQSLNEHIFYVREAGQKIGVLSSLLEGHDDSKWTKDEFIGYANHFQGGGAPSLFAPAWLHHIHHNPHHWQHWIFPDGYTPKGSDVENGVNEMPIYYALEMIADWMGAGRTYTGSWDMADWLCKNMGRIGVHSNTAEYLRSVLDNPLGYADVVYMTKFKDE